MNPNPTPAAASEQPDPLAELAELAAKELPTLTKDNAPGWYECQSHKSDIRRMLYWDGERLSEHFDKVRSRGWLRVQLKNHHSFVGPFTPATLAAIREQQQKLTYAEAEIRGVKSFAGWAEDDSRPADSAAGELFMEGEELRAEVAELKSALTAAQQERDDLAELVIGYRNQIRNECLRAEAAEQGAAALREWKTAVLSAVRHIPEYAGPWAGDKEGWGFAFEVIRWQTRHVEVLKQEAATLRAERDALRAALEQIAKAPTFLQGGDGLSGPCVWCEMSATKLVADEALSISTNSPSGQE